LCAIRKEKTDGREDGGAVGCRLVVGYGDDMGDLGRGEGRRRLPCDEANQPEHLQNALEYFSQQNKQTHGNKNGGGGHGEAKSGWVK
jgi:hypothetical protein